MDGQLLRAAYSKLTDRPDRTVEEATPAPPFGPNLARMARSHGMKHDSLLWPAGLRRSYAYENVPTI